MPPRQRSEGSIETLPSGRLRVRVYAGPDPVTGRPRYLREIVDTKAQAKAARLRLLNQVQERRQPHLDITVSKAIEQWLEVAEHEKSTRERYEQLIRLYITPNLGTTQLAKLDAEVLERFYARLLRCRTLCTGGKRPGHECEPLAPNTVRKIHFILSAVGARAVRWTYVTANEAAMAEPPAFSQSDPDPPSAAEVAALLNEASRDPEWALFLWLTMVAGWRRGEACALRWTDVDLERGVITIERSHYRREEKRTKTRQRRNIATDAETVEMFAAHLAQCVADCEKLSTVLAADAFLFSQAPDHSMPLLPRGVSQRYRRLTERAGRRSTRLRALRHYSATELVAAGVDVRTVAGRLGHGSGGAMTLKVYAAWSSKADRRAAGTIAGIVPRPDPTQRPARNAHEQLAHELRSAIAEGDMTPGAVLPTAKELAVSHQMSTGTVSRAIGVLRDEGLIDVARGQRAVVRPRPPQPRGAQPALEAGSD